MSAVDFAIRRILEQLKAILSEARNNFSSFVCLHRERAAAIKKYLNLNREERL